MSENNVSVPEVVQSNDSSSSPPLEAPNPAFAAPLGGHDIAPSSTRTSFTRVDHDEEQNSRIQPSTSHDPVTPQPPLPTQPESSNSPSGQQVDEASASRALLSTSTLEQPSLKLETDTPAMPELAVDEAAVPQMPQTYLTFLLISGKRRTMSFEPETAIGRVKELVWNSWPADWQDDRPPAPSYLRVLYLGRLLQDDETLTKLKLPTYTPLPSSTPATPSSTGPTPTIMHLSIRPYAPPNEGDGLKKKKRRGGDDNSANNEPLDEEGGAGCCRCIIC
ncbi:hypothetical protein CVT26_004067 [Gymnopilus dilepis]|uniref:Ubiquitin-like domain-containing protein n=1 Tax=Gymnopilus dilepis TaxID=231916 RepID=A0A409YMH4_9AGAR|nr:hypothetical protein CVT26_004067 [Gymnopilus dilepis]